MSLAKSYHVSSEALSGSLAERVIALAGNPNTGKSTVFNALTGLKQHTGNWTGKTVARAEGFYWQAGRKYRLVDLPGTYSLLSTSVDEEIARDFLLFGGADAVVVVVDATALERNLNLVLQVLEITGRVVICLNLMDEAERKQLQVDPAQLAAELGVPVVPCVATTGQGMEVLKAQVAGIIDGVVAAHPRRVPLSGRVERAIEGLLSRVERLFPDLPNARWVALRLLDGDPRVRQAVLEGELSPPDSSSVPASDELLALVQAADAGRRSLDGHLADSLVQAIYAEAGRIAARVVSGPVARSSDFDRRLDRLLTSPLTGLPIMLLLLAGVFWLTVVGANYPSQMIASGLFWLEDWIAGSMTLLGAPWWLTGFLMHGVWRGLAWVVSVMLPPTAIFFPLFTLLEDLGYLPRVAFNVDRAFRMAGVQGTQALTMCMGFGCNAAGVASCRIIKSPRERLIAILTNTFVPCNGRFPTLIMLSTVFVAAAVPPLFASFAAAGSVVLVVLLGVLVTLVVSAVLSRTVLRGEVSFFVLELPPYRRPQLLQTLYTSFIDRTLLVLKRAVVMAAPAGAAIWLLGNLSVDGQSLAMWLGNALNPLGHALGLDGVILLAFVAAIPANEIVVPTMLMVYSNTGMMIELSGMEQLRALLVGQAGWTLLTAVNLMLFSLLHNPCSTTILTIWKETRSLRWTLVGALMPLGLAFAATFGLTQAARLFGWV